MGIQINGNTNNINAGIGSLSIEDLNELHIVGVATAANFKTGTSNLHSTGLNIFDLDVDGHAELDNVNVAGVTTFNEDISFKGAQYNFLYDRSLNTLKFDQGIAAFGTSGGMTLQNSTFRGVTQIQANGLYIKNLSNQQMITCFTGGRIELYHNNSKKFETTGAGVTVTNGHLQQQYGGIASKVGYVSGGAEAYFGSTSNHSLVLGTNNTERLRITTSGSIGLNGANYGSAGQVFTSQGSGSAPTWSTISGTTINNNANNRIITGSGTANTLEGQANVTFISPQLRINAGDTSSVQVDGLYSYVQAAGVRMWRGAGNRSHNMGCGANTLANASGGQDCTALGHNALTNSTSGSANTALGSHSMVGTVTGSNNVAVGHGALNKNTSGYNNTVVGRIAGLENLGGHNNTFLGMDAGTNNTSGHANIYAGSGAGKFETNSNDNVVIGYNAFGANRTGGNSSSFNKNTVVGHQALTQQRISNGDGENVCIGYRTMYNTITAAWRNVVIGFEAGYNNQASKTTFVGTFAGKSYQSGGNTMCLGYNAGTSDSPSGNLTNQQDTICLGNNGISQLYCNDTSISSSDARDKTDITEWTHGLSFINQLKPVTYRWDKRTWYGTDEEPMGTPDGSKKRARLHLGFLAQDALEVEKSFGYASKKDDMLAVNLNEDGSAYGMKYERLVVPLTKAVQELSAEVDKLKAEIAALKS